MDDALPEAETNPVDGEKVPSRHLALFWSGMTGRHFQKAGRCQNLVFDRTTNRFEGEVGEQATMFFRDPSGNALEFKAFKDKAMIFAK